MEISREHAMATLRRWKRAGNATEIVFAARGGTAGGTMLARIAEVSSRIAFEGDGSNFRFSLQQARFAYGPIEDLGAPTLAGRRKVDGLHIWLESGHWLFIAGAARKATGSIGPSKSSQLPK